MISHHPGPLPAPSNKVDMVPYLYDIRTNESAASSGVFDKWGSYPPSPSLHPRPLPKQKREITEMCG